MTRQPIHKENKTNECKNKASIAADTHFDNYLHLVIAFGAAYGTAKSGVGICVTSVMRPEQMIRNSIPVIMVRLAVYGMTVIWS